MSRTRFLPWMVFYFLNAVKTFLPMTNTVAALGYSEARNRKPVYSVSKASFSTALTGENCICVSIKAVWLLAGISNVSNAPIENQKRTLSTVPVHVVVISC